MKTCFPLAALLAATLAATLSAQPPTITAQSPSLTSPIASPGNPPAGRPPSLAPAPPPADKVVATVDGKDITYGDLLQLLSIAPPNVARSPQLALQQYFIMRYLASEGEKLKLAERSPLKEELEFQRINMVAGAMLNLQRESYQIPPGAAEAYYKANLSKYEQAKIKVIFVAFKPAVAGSVSTTDDLARAAQSAVAQVHSGTDRSEAQARSLAAEIVAKARSGGDFAALVGQYSDDPVSKAAQGDFGTIKHDSTSYPEDLKRVVFALDTGQVSEPLRQGAGFYIIRVEDKSPQPLDEVSPDIFQNLRQQNLSEWFTAVNKRFKPEIKDPAAFVQSGASGTIVAPAGTALPNGPVPGGAPSSALPK